MGRRFGLRDFSSAAFVVLVPTLATVYAEWVKDWAGWQRHVLFSAWMLAAGILVVDQVRRNSRSDRSFDALDDLTADERQQQRQLALDARAATMRAFLTPDFWFPRKWDWTVYLYDETIDMLTPLWPHDANSEQGKTVSFAPGRGATGQAWRDEETVVRVGPEVHDGSHGLTDRQQAHFSKRNSVVATPIWSDKQKMGVLAGIADDYDRQFENEESRSHLQRTATIIGTLLATLSRAEYD